MDPDRWRQIDQLYLSVLEREPSLRSAFLAEACHGDVELRREIESLLGQQASCDGALSRPPIDLPDSSLDPITVGAELAPCRTHPLSPSSFLAQRFRIVREVGSGGMGLVYEAIDEKLNRRVALKCARPGYGDRLPPEVRAAREVSHFNVCKVHDLHTVSTVLGEMEFVSMEFIEGQTLSQRISREGPLPEAEARSIARQICAGLAQAHRQGVIHGDLKCGNVILSELPQGGIRAVITDFGLAKMEFIDSGCGTGGGAGTRDYMAPELLLGERPTVASDLYALGILFHVMLTGHSPKPLENPFLPLTQASWELDSKASTLTLSSPMVDAQWQRIIEDLPSPWEKVVARCLEPRSENRFSSAETVSDALETRRFWLKWSAAAVLAAVVSLGYWQWSAGPKGPPVRLAVLPFSIQGGTVEGAAGMGLDVADRLSSSRRNFNVISPREAELNHVDTPQKARSIGCDQACRRNRSLGQPILTTSRVSNCSGKTHITPTRLFPI